MLTGIRAYFPPELFIYGKFHAVSTNVWALGVLLYEMMNTCSPFRNITEIIQAQIRFENPDLSKGERIALITHIQILHTLEIRGGAEDGEFPHLEQVLSDALVCHVGRLPGPGDVLLEVNGTPVSGLTNRDTLAVIRHFREPLRLKTVKPG